ncbi:uncharacterized protein [Lepidochelys kempii]|uniref:uncharacterized protein n=1 Tax=Lepidochelys kempii TaxID=8472 RepID=UPI003C701EF9
MTPLTDILSTLKLCPEDAWNRMSKMSETRPTAQLPAPAPRPPTSLTSCRHSSTARLLAQLCLGQTRLTSSRQAGSSASFHPPLEPPRGPRPPGPGPPAGTCCGAPGPAGPRPGPSAAGSAAESESSSSASGPGQRLRTRPHGAILDPTPSSPLAAPPHAARMQISAPPRDDATAQPGGPPGPGPIRPQHRATPLSLARAAQPCQDPRAAHALAPPAPVRGWRRPRPAPELRLLPPRGSEAPGPRQRPRPSALCWRAPSSRLRVGRVPSRQARLQAGAERPGPRRGLRVARQRSGKGSSTAPRPVFSQGWLRRN